MCIFEKTESKVLKVLCLKWKQMFLQVISKIFSFLSNKGCQTDGSVKYNWTYQMHATRWHLKSDNTFRDQELITAFSKWNHTMSSK